MRLLTLQFPIPEPHPSFHCPCSPVQSVFPRPAEGGGRETDLNRLQLSSTVSQTLGLGPSPVDLTSPPRDSDAIKYGSRVLAKSLVFLFQVCSYMIKKVFPGFVLPTQHIWYLNFKKIFPTV